MSRDKITLVRVPECLTVAFRYLAEESDGRERMFVNMWNSPNTPFRWVSENGQQLSPKFDRSFYTKDRP